MPPFHSNGYPRFISKHFFFWCKCFRIIGLFLDNKPYIICPISFSMLFSSQSICLLQHFLICKCLHGCTNWFIEVFNLPSKHPRFRETILNRKLLTKILQNLLNLFKSAVVMVTKQSHKVHVWWLEPKKANIFCQINTAIWKIWTPLNF